MKHLTEKAFTKLVKWIYRVIFNKYAIVISAIPLRIIVTDSIKLSNKGKMALKYIDDNPDSTISDFKKDYAAMFNKK